MTSRAEQNVSRSLRAVLADLPNGASIPETASFREVLSGLEFFLPEVLQEIHPEWIHESLDDILPEWVRKAGEREVEIFGVCIIISDQSVTPLHLRFQIAKSSDEVSWLDLRFGERGRERTPYDLLTDVIKRLYSLDMRSESIDWECNVAFGQ